MAKVEEVIADDKTYHGMRFNHDEMHIVCPWHGWEYDLETVSTAEQNGARWRRKLGLSFLKTSSAAEILTFQPTAG